MQVHTFIAESVAQAVEQIRGELGSQAVVLNVRRLPAEGLARLWQRPRIELLATVPDQPAAEANAVQALAQLRQEVAEIKQQFAVRPPVVPPAEVSRKSVSETPSANALWPRLAASTIEVVRPQPKPGEWQVQAVLESAGLLPMHVQHVLDLAKARLGDRPPADLAEELQATRQALLELWRQPLPATSNTHVFIGPPGTGKTTVLCKQLAQAVLIEGRRARVWRLDSQVANTAESLSVFAEILGVPVERIQPEPDQVEADELICVDLPGVNPADSAGLAELGKRLERFPGAQIHLVLNAAYATRLLLTQARSFQGLPVSDMILTHLDEESRWGQLWNVVLGTNYTLGFLSAGQNLPGEFGRANPERLLAGEFR